MKACLHGLPKSAKEATRFLVQDLLHTTQNLEKLTNVKKDPWHFFLHKYVGRSAGQYVTKSFENWSSKPTNRSILQKNMLAKASRFVTSSLEKAFFAWGLTVARHPFPVSIIKTAITVIRANNT